MARGGGPAVGSKSEGCIKRLSRVVCRRNCEVVNRLDSTSYKVGGGRLVEGAKGDHAHEERACAGVTVTTPAQEGVVTAVKVAGRQADRGGLFRPWPSSGTVLKWTFVPSERISKLKTSHLVRTSKSGLKEKPRLLPIKRVAKGHWRP